ncbi:MAG: secretion protein HlyD [Akkermansiaceae bacterium]|nr:secretion protein HlyD [Akkermansiaceae bacterium]
MKKIIIIVVLLAGLGYGAWRYIKHKEAENGPLTLHGNVDIRSVDLGFRVSGKLLDLLKDEGDTVKAGELIAKLDSDPYQRALGELQASLAGAEADAKLKQGGYRQEEIDKARAASAQAKVALEFADRAYKRQSGLVQENGVSRQSFENAQGEYEQAMQAYNSAEANRKQLEAGYQPEEVQAAVAKAEQAKAAIATAQLQIADTELKAPTDGIVMTRAVEKGAILQAGATVYSISLEKPVWIRAYVHEPELGQVAPNTKVTVHTDGGKTFHGTVGYVSPQAEFTPKSVETDQLRTSLVYRLRVIVEDSDGTLRQGMPVTITLDDTAKK